MILHLDMDAFFASVEQLDNPALRGRPVIVGGRERGVAAAASYEARVFGVRSAMPIAQAKKLCPTGVFVPGRYARYSEISAGIMACLKSFGTPVQPASIDEAYMDISELKDELIDIALNIKDAIRARVGPLSCSIGIAPVKFLAKICSDVNKPDGVFILRPEDADEFLTDLPVGAIPGVGKAMKASLRAFGVYTAGQLRNLSREFLSERYGKFGLVLHDRARGLDERSVHDNEPARSEGREHTFAEDVSSRRVLKDKLRELADRIGASLTRRGAAGRTITLKLKFADFRQITRSRTIETPAGDGAAIWSVAARILDAVAPREPARLIGISVSGFDERSRQLYLPGLESMGGAFAAAPREQRSRPDGE